MNAESQHAILSILKSDSDRPFKLLEIADRLNLSPEQAKAVCQELLALDLVDLSPLPRMFGQREVDFGFVLTCRGRWVFGETVNLRSTITGFNKE